MRTYGGWAGDPRDPEDPKRCVVEVPSPRYSRHSHQCRYSRGHGPQRDLCKIHSRIPREKLSIPPDVEEQCA